MFTGPDIACLCEVENDRCMTALMDALNAVSTPQVALETKTPGSPGVLKPVGEDGHIHVVMPMYLANR